MSNFNGFTKQRFLIESDLASFRIRRAFFYSDFPGLGAINIDTVLNVPIDAQLLPMSELESIAEITEESLNATTENWKKIAKGTDFEEILNAETE